MLHTADLLSPQVDLPASIRRQVTDDLIALGHSHLEALSREGNGVAAVTSLRGNYSADLGADISAEFVS